MPLTKLQFRAGINKELTSYSNEGGWIDCDKVRFVFGYPQKIGGWIKYSSETYLGTARRLHNWLGLDNANYLGIGTHLKYYIDEGGSYSDITPLRGSTITLGNNPLTTNTTTGTEKEVKVTHSNHGAGENDFVTMSGSPAVNGVPAAELNKEHQITRIVDGNNYIITVVSNATSAGAGGSNAVKVIYQINVGLDSQVGGTGWSAGLWGGQIGAAQATTLNGALLSDTAGTGGSGTTITLTSGTGFPDSGFIKVEEEIISYSGKSTNDLTGIARGALSSTITAHNNGVAVIDTTNGWGMSSATTTTTELRTWSNDNFGEDLLINPKDGAVYYWDKSNGLSTRAVNISTLPSADKFPTVAKQILVSDSDRHVIAFGTDIYNTSIQDPLMIRWSTQESAAIWTISSTTTAGSLRLGSGSTFVQAVETKMEIIVFTDTAVHSMKYIGDPFIFGIQQLASNITIMGSKAAVASEDLVFWMGIDNFYVYSGGTQQLTCPVKDKVFNNFNYSQKEKVYASINSEFSEIIWFYPSLDNSLANGGNGQNDKYVIYNYKEQVWYYGSLARSAWIDRGLRNYPIAAESGYLYNQEYEFDADGSAMISYIESAPLTIGDGNEFSLVQRVIPDLTFEGSLNTSSPAAQFSLKTRNFPGTNFNETSSGTAIRTSTTPVEQYTNELYLRARGRSFALRVDSSALGMKWKLGTPRVEIRKDGRQ